jgi:DAK2 domain fusion protein YloV
VTVLDVLDAPAVRRWSRAAVDRLDAHRAEIDALNVFPVPDSDTGRNMLLTLRSADQALTGIDADLPVSAALAALSAGAARGAIGNSGFLLSQILRGLADSASRARRCDAAVLAAGLDEGAALARSAVVTPVDGTILTVARAAADAASAAPDGGLAAVLGAAVAAADEALQRTPEQLPELAEAGVVDAGGRGLVLVLDALAAAVTGSGRQLTDVRLPSKPLRESVRPAAQFEVQYLLDAPAGEVERLCTVLDGLGDSVAVVGAGRDAWKVHVHAGDVGAVIEAGLGVGRLQQISVVALDTRVPDEIAGRSGEAGTARVVVAVAPGAGVTHLLEREGVQVVDEPAADEIARSLPDGVCEVVLLAGAIAAQSVADRVASDLRHRELRVSVVPIRSPVQALAAVAVHDRARRFDDDVVAMAEAAAATRYAEVTVAETAALTAVGLCQPGDVLGLIDGDVVEIGHSVLAVTFDLLDRLLSIGAELVTVLTGTGFPDQAGSLLESHVRTRSPLTDVAVYSGGQPDHPVIIGAE